MKANFFYITLFSLSGFIANSQDLTDNLKSWSGINVAYKINPKLSLKLNQLFAINFSPIGYSFSQTKLSLTYKLKRRTYLGGGYSRGLFNDTNSLRRQGATESWFNTLAIDRVFANFSYKHDLVKRLSLRHKIEYQVFFSDLDKYKTRSYYSARLAYNIRGSIFTPYIENQWFYYQGGELSNGIKRYRFKLGTSFRPNKGSSMRVSIYYILQNEFNTEQLSDNDYSVLGLSLSFKINSK